jgi:hypothetical protein
MSTREEPTLISTTEPVDALTELRASMRELAERLVGVGWGVRGCGGPDVVSSHYETRER